MLHCNCNNFMALICKQHLTAHHRAVWSRFETCLHTRSFLAVPLICIFGLVRLFLFNQGTGLSSDDNVVVGLNCILITHRSGWIPLLALGLKWPKLCHFYHCYEMLAMVLESVLSLSGSKTPEAHNFTLLYLLLMNVLVFSAFYYNLWINFSTIIVHAVTVVITCHFLYETENLPPAYQ